MKDEIILGLGENKVSVKQNSAGIWLCNELSIYCSDPLNGIELMDKAIDLMDVMLQKKNQVKK